MPSRADRTFLELAATLARRAEIEGNLPVGCVIAYSGHVVSTGQNRTRAPVCSPGRHAETEALASLPIPLLERTGELTCYTTLEPCLMCFGSLVIHGIGRVVFGSLDQVGGATALGSRLPPFPRRQARSIEWVGPALTGVCDPLRDRVLSKLGLG